MPGEGATKDMIFADVAARVLNRHFNDKFHGYPAFKDLLQPLSKDNFDDRIKNALKKITNTSQQNRDGEAILSGLGLWSGQNIDTQNSKYADSILKKLKERADKFEKLVGYLYTAQSYVVEGEQPLYDDITRSINNLGAVMASGKDADVKKYEALLYSLVDRYADYYLNHYTRYRLSAADARVKDRLLNSENKRICDIIKDSEFVTATEYKNWINSITSLREADVSLTKSGVKEEPYHDFNPREYYGRPCFKVHELEEQLEGILGKWVNAMRSVFKDPSVQDNLELLEANDRKMVEDFRTGRIELDMDNAAGLRNLIGQLTQGIDKIEISPEDFRKQLDKPLTPQEAIDTITEYINNLCAGRERSKVRIIVK